MQRAEVLTWINECASCVDAINPEQNDQSKHIKGHSTLSFLYRQHLSLYIPKIQCKYTFSGSMYIAQPRFIKRKALMKILFDFENVVF